MHPVLFSIGTFDVHSYGVILALAIVLGVLLAGFIGEKRGCDRFDISEVGLWTVIIGILGARFVYVIQYTDFYFSHPELLLNFRRGGIAIQGALLFGFSATAWTCHRRNINVFNGLDIYINPVLMGMAIGRIGCLLQGCCYGRLCDPNLPWGVVYPAALKIGTEPRHPSQIYELLLDLVLMVVVGYVYKHAKYYGQAFWTGIAGYGVVRFITEYFRDVQVSWLFTPAQWFALVFVLVGLLGALGLYSRTPIVPLQADIALADKKVAPKSKK